MKFSLGDFLRKDRRLGVAIGRGRYDLPLNKDEGTNFLRLLIALMSFLAAMALAGSFALDSMTQRWSSGLENKLTIEIPAEKQDGELRSAEEVASLLKQVEAVLRNEPIVKTVDVLDDKDIQELVEPWLGADAPLQDIPLPGLVSVELNSSEPEAMEKMTRDIAVIDSGIVIDTHEAWLQSLLKMIGSLRFAAMAVVLIIAATTVTAIAGAIRSRIAVHKADVELLHLMGANDEYIIRQFQRHALTIALQGSMAGTVAAGAVLLTVKLASGGAMAEVLPVFTAHMAHTVAVAILPLIACGIAALTARFTVLRSLSLMP
ncbi:MAG: permease [Alphaproteobacteria bacterium]